MVNLPGDNKVKNRIVIKNGVLLVMDDAWTLYDDGMVVIEDDKIAAIGPTSDLAPKYPQADRVIDARGKAVMPGLVNLHFHSGIGKGYCDHLPLMEYLMTAWYPLTRNVSSQEAYWAAMCSYSEAIRSGATTVNDQWRQMEACGDAAEAIGMRAVLCCDVADDEHQLDSLADNERLYQAKHGRANGRIEVYVGIEWLPLSSRKLLVGARDLANKLQTGIHIHLNESLSEVQESLRLFGRRPTEFAYDCGILGSDCVAAHCVWLSDAEIALMRETGTNISHNPASNAKLGNGIARVPEMVRAGINVGVGHDAAECNNSVDLFSTMKFASLIHRANRVDASLFPPQEVLAMATKNGSKALKHNTGSLEVGKKADLILINLKNEHFTPLVLGEQTNIYSHLLFAANGADVHTSIIDGRVVMEDRRLTMVDQDEVFAKANEAFHTLLKRI